MAAYATAVTLLKDIPSGHNILTCLLVFEAASEDEARGFAVKQAMESNPKHRVFTVIVAPINISDDSATHDTTAAPHPSSEARTDGAEHG